MQKGLHSLICFERRAAVDTAVVVVASHRRIAAGDIRLKISWSHPKIELAAGDLKEQSRLFGSHPHDSSHLNLLFRWINRSGHHMHNYLQVAFL